MWLSFQTAVFNSCLTFVPRRDPRRVEKTLLACRTERFSSSPDLHVRPFSSHGLSWYYEYKILLSPENVPDSVTSHACGFLGVFFLSCP
jgi:hypothetical protein